MKKKRSGAPSQAAEWEQVLSSLCHLQSILPDAVLVGGTAAVLYAGHRLSTDHDHVLTDLRTRFDRVLEQLESASGWKTARTRRPNLILGSLDGIETGVRQLRRSQPLETTTFEVRQHTIRLPTLAEILRIKAFLCLDRNATRDYVDLAALARHMGLDAAVAALSSMDALYPQASGDGWAVRTQLVKQLADPRPYDLGGVSLAEYKGIHEPFDRWEYVAGVCSSLAGALVRAFAVKGTAADGLVNSPETLKSEKN